MSNETKPTAPEGVKEVTKEEFYATVGQRDVHPTPRPGKMFQNGWSRSDWKDRAGRVLGVTLDSETYPVQKLYYTNLMTGRA